MSLINRIDTHLLQGTVDLPEAGDGSDVSHGGEWRNILSSMIFQCVDAIIFSTLALLPNANCLGYRRKELVAQTGPISVSPQANIC